jgi:hypothetical protein
MTDGNLPKSDQMTTEETVSAFEEKSALPERTTEGEQKKKCEPSVECACENRLPTIFADYPTLFDQNAWQFHRFWVSGSDLHVAIGDWPQKWIFGVHLSRKKKLKIMALRFCKALLQFPFPPIFFVWAKKVLAYEIKTFSLFPVHPAQGTLTCIGHSAQVVFTLSRNQRPFTHQQQQQQ